MGASANALSPNQSAMVPAAAAGAERHVSRSSGDDPSDNWPERRKEDSGDVTGIGAAIDPGPHVEEEGGHGGLGADGAVDVLGIVSGQAVHPALSDAVEGRVVEAAAGHQDTPGIVIGIDEGEQPSNQGTQHAVGIGRPADAVADPGVEAADEAYLDGVEQTAAVTQVVVDQWARDAGLGRHLLEAEQERVLGGQQPFGGVDDQIAPDLRIEPTGPGPIGQTDVAPRVTGTADSSGESGW